MRYFEMFIGNDGLRRQLCVLHVKDVFTLASTVRVHVLFNSCCGHDINVSWRRKR